MDPLQERKADLADSAPEVQESQLHRSAQRWRLVLRTVFLALAALAWLALAEEVQHERSRTLAAVAERDANLAVAVEHYLVRVLRTARAVHQLLGSLLAQGRGDAELVQMLSSRLRANDAFQELGLCMADGRVLRVGTNGARLTPATCARIAAAVRPAREISMLPPLPSPAGLQIPLALPLEDDSGVRLAIAVALTPAETALGVMQSAVLREDTAVTLAGADGVPRAAWRSHGGHVTQPAGFAPLAELLRARGTRATIQDRDYLVSSRTLPDAALRIQVASAANDALAAFTGRSTRLIVLCVLVTLALGGVYRMLARMHGESLARSRALSRARHDLQLLNAQLDNQVQERTAQLEQAYRDMETFSYAVAHDVRAPLASIAGFASALEPVVAASGDGRHLHYLKRIQANAAEMDEITRQLLELGRLTRAPLQPTRVDLGAMAHEIVARLREGDPQRAVEVSVEPELWAQGDRTLLRQVMENLVGNAWKFSARRPLAHIAVARAPGEGGAGEIVVAVSDDGEGFDSEQAPGLFQPFRRMHGSDEFPGTGVGLAAVQRIVALHGGRVWCRSKPGMGAQFFVTLPA